MRAGVISASSYLSGVEIQHGPKLMAYSAMTLG